MDVRSEPRGAPARSRTATRARLRASATGLFARRGVHAVTSYQIAREAGVASGTFYLHYRDKGELFREIVCEAVEQMRQRLRRAGDGARDAADSVRRCTAALVVFAEENRDLIRILFAHGRGAGDPDSDALDTLAAQNEAELRERAVAGGSPSDIDPAIAAQAIVGMLARVVTWWVEDPARATRDDVIRTLCRIQLEGTQLTAD